MTTMNIYLVNEHPNMQAISAMQKLIKCPTSIWCNKAKVRRQ